MRHAYLYPIKQQQNNSTMFFSQLPLAESFRNRAFETAGKSYMIVVLEGNRFQVCTRREASALAAKGFEVL